MSKKITKKIVAMAMIVSCLVGMAYSANASGDIYNQSISTPSGSTRYSWTVEKSGYSKMYSTRITAHSFNCGYWPSGKSIALTMVTGDSNASAIGATIVKYSTTYNATERGSYIASWRNQTGDVKIKVKNNVGENGTIQLRWSWDNYSSL